jgi:hypothetical protein
MKKPTKKRRNSEPSRSKPGKKLPVQSSDGVLIGWPKIANYLGQPSAVAQRWAKDGMPVERKGRLMTAKPEELSKWLGNEAGAMVPVHIAQSSDEDLLVSLRRGLAEAKGSKRKPS